MRQKRLVFPAQERKKNEQQGQEGKGKHDPEESAHSQMVVGIEVEILRVSDGGGHASKVGGNGLQNDHRDQPVLAADHFQQLNGEGDKGDQRHVIGDEHAGEKTQEDQEHFQLPETVYAH